MNPRLKLPVLSVALAIAITTTMDATGLTMFSALPLLPLVGLFWFLSKLSRAEFGLTWGRWRDYGLALLHSVAVLGVIVAIALLTGAVDTSDANWQNAGVNILAGSTVGILVVVLTEEGFFRGWLWGSLRRAGLSDRRVLIWTSAIFALWHVSWATLDTGFNLPVTQIPVYLINATVIGVIWGMMRMVSGSVLVPSVAHAVWNAVIYPLFGVGTQAGALGVNQKHVYGPEVGWLGLGLSITFAALLWRVGKGSREGEKWGREGGPRGD